MKDTCGRSLPLPSMRFDQDSLSWRTCEATSLWDLEMSSPSFPEWGMTRDGELFELPTPERPTVGQGSSSLPTPTARDYKDTSIAAASHRPSDEDTLSRALHHLTFLKTPVATEKGKLDRPERYLNRNEPGGRFDLSDQVASLLPRAQNGETRNQNIYARPLDQPQNLENSLALLPTPLASDYKQAAFQPSLSDPKRSESISVAIMNLLPTPVVNDMGSDKTLEWWEAWTKKIGGHGDSLSIEMRKLTGESTTEPSEDGSECLEDQLQIPLSPE